MNDAMGTTQLLQRSVALTVHLDRENQLKDKVIAWLASGRTGRSSKSMAIAACGVDLTLFGPSHPRDPDDFNRCLVLLSEAPEIRGRMDRVAALSETWAALVENWDEIEQCFLFEAGFDWGHATEAPLTFQKMKAIGC